NFSLSFLTSIICFCLLFFSSKSRLLRLTNLLDNSTFWTNLPSCCRARRSIEQYVTIQSEINHKVIRELAKIKPGLVCFFLNTILPPKSQFKKDIISVLIQVRK